jgi:hypothetical protein
MSRQYSMIQGHLNIPQLRSKPPLRQHQLDLAATHPQAVLQRRAMELRPLHSLRRPVNTRINQHILSTKHLLGQFSNAAYVPGSRSVALPTPPPTTYTPPYTTPRTEVHQGAPSPEDTPRYYDLPTPANTYQSSTPSDAVTSGLGNFTLASNATS